MSLRDDLLPAIDAIRGIPDQLGTRLYDVSIRVRSWSGSRPAVDNSSSSDADAAFGVDAGTHRTRVVQLTSRDLIASGGNYSDADLKVGPLTPKYAGGGFEPSDFDPEPTSAPVEIFFKIVGPGMRAGGSWFKKINTNVVGTPFRYTFIVRAVAETP